LTRRLALLVLLAAAGPLLALAPPASAQPAPGITAGATTTAPAPRPAPRPASRKPAPADPVKQRAEAQPLRTLEPTVQLGQGAPAPIPDRSRDLPWSLPEQRASLNPSVINRPLPGRGQAVEGSANFLEEKLFRPAAGARLSVPFSY
jgi:hypothetical protein